MAHTSGLGRLLSGATHETLRDSGEYRQLDNRIGIVLYDSLTGILKKKIQAASEKSDREGYKLKGRQIQLMIYEAYKIEDRGKSFFQYADLMAVRLVCASKHDCTPKELEEFIVQWDSINDAMEWQVHDNPDGIRLLLVHQNVEHVGLISRDIEDYDRKPLNERTYDFLYKAVTRVLDDKRMRRKRNKVTPILEQGPRCSSFACT